MVTGKLFKCYCSETIFSSNQEFLEQTIVGKDNYWEKRFELNYFTVRQWLMS